MGTSNALIEQHQPDTQDERDTVQVEDLVCPGCGSPADPEPPIQWPAGAGRAPEFSHRDGSVLCPDGRGRIGEPVERPGPAAAPSGPGREPGAARAGVGRAGPHAAGR